jgi:hypothetical protein
MFVAGEEINLYAIMLGLNENGLPNKGQTYVINLVNHNGYGSYHPAGFTNFPSDKKAILSSLAASNNTENEVRSGTADYMNASIQSLKDFSK